MRQIAQISDIHFGADDPAAVKALREDLLAEPYDLLVVSGDFTQRARPSQYREAMAFVKGLPGPHLYVPGNHDIPLYDVFRRFFAPTSRYRTFVTKDLLPVFADDEILVIGVNTARPFSWTWRGFWKDGRISADQLLDVHLACAEAEDGLFKVVVTHHPFLPPPDARGHGAVELEGAEEDSHVPDREHSRDREGKFRISSQVIRGSARSLRSMEALGVELLLAGHLHMNYVGDVRSHHERVRRSILSVQAGTACSHRRRGEPNAYNRIRVESKKHDGLERDRVTIRVRTLEGPSFGDGSVTTFEKHENGWG